jgi:hypothetical protein
MRFFLFQCNCVRISHIAIEIEKIEGKDVEK